jgi:hypothetical protein
VKPRPSGQVLITSVLALSKTDGSAFGGRLTSAGGRAPGPRISPGPGGRRLRRLAQA